ncbi:RUN/FYVE domain protein, partial [Thalictrum thalictroides]
MRKMDQISAFEKDFINKIQFLENKLRYTEEELRKKDAHISELQGQLEAAKISYHPEVEEISSLILIKSLSMKDEVIQNITAEKKALRCEVRGLEIALRKIQDAVMSMEAEDQKLISSALEDHGECVESSEKENDRSDTADPNCREECLRNHIDQGAAENK